MALGTQTKGNHWFHKSGVEDLLFVMNPTLMSLIKTFGYLSRHLLSRETGTKHM
jgi:hypothetical protein